MQSTLWDLFVLCCGCEKLGSSGMVRGAGFVSPPWSYLAYVQKAPGFTDPASGRPLPWSTNKTRLSSDVPPQTILSSRSEHSTYRGLPDAESVMSGRLHAFASPHKASNIHQWQRGIPFSVLQRLHPWATIFTASVLAMDIYNAVGVAQIRSDAPRHAQMQLSSRRSLVFANHPGI